MDSGNEEEINHIRSSTPSTIHTHPTTAATTDDESSLTTSTDSELLSTWTLVTDKTKLKHEEEEDKKKQQTQQLADELKQAINEAVIQRVEELQHTHVVEDEEEVFLEEADTKVTKADSSMDDLSDGISIISESDSGGRLTPHPFLADLKFSDSYQLNDDIIAKGVPIVIEGGSTELRQRRRKRSSSRSRRTEGEIAVAQALQPNMADLVVANGERLQTIVRRGLSGIFYVGVAVALLALYGKLHNPEWEPLSGAQQPLAELQQRVIAMELQNNLMRAEIDILSRQVNYLSNAKHTTESPQMPQQPPKEEKSRSKGKHFKAWSGNGERLEPVDINKGDLKRPYKCPNGQFVEIAGMCVENAQESLVNTVGDVFEALREGSALLKDIEAEETSKPMHEEQQAEKVEIPKPNFDSPLPSQKCQKGLKCQNSKEQQRPYPSNSKERFGPGHNNNKENRYPKNADSRENSRPRFKGSNDDSRESTERFHRDSREKHNSKEQWRKQPYPKGSPERFQKGGSGEWHEKLMQQREFSRRQHEQKRNDKNWYIERGSGREHMRYS